MILLTFRTFFSLCGIPDIVDIHSTFIFLTHIFLFNIVSIFSIVVNSWNQSKYEEIYIVFFILKFTLSSFILFYGLFFGLKISAEEQKCDEEKF